MCRDRHGFYDRLKSGCWAMVCVIALPAPALAAPASLPPVDPEIRCMADAIAYEAGNEPLAGQEAVAQVILNRLRDPHYPKSVCEVVYQGSARRTGCQFTFTCDGALSRTLPEKIRAAAAETARRALDGALAETVSGATHYHADYVVPLWSHSLTRIATIGRHIFYRQPRAGNMPPNPTISSVPHATSGFNAWGITIATDTR